MKDILEMIRKKEKGYFIMQMEIDIKGIFQVDIIRGLAFFILIMEIDMKGNLNKINIQEKENIIIIMEIDLKDIG